MAIVSMRSKRRVLEIAIAAFLCFLAFLMQVLALNYFGIHGSICNLPLTLTIVWGLVFGSSMRNLTAVQLRKRSFREIFAHQLASGSHSAFLVGWLFSWLFNSVMPVYPIYFPLIGWTAGYFCLRGLGQGNLLAIPMTFVLTIVAEALMSWQLYLVFLFFHQSAKPDEMVQQFHILFDHLNTFILPEALLNSIIAPFIYFPMRSWYDLVEGERSSLSIDD